MGVLYERETHVFSKHSVSPARDESFQLQEIPDESIVDRGRFGHECPVTKLEHLELAKEVRISTKVSRFVVFLRHGCPECIVSDVCLDAQY